MLDKNKLTKVKKGLWHQFKCEYLVTIKKEHSKLKRNHDEVVCPDCEKVVRIKSYVNHRTVNGCKKIHPFTKFYNYDKYNGDEVKAKKALYGNK